jgi:hypothetical protein
MDKDLLSSLSRGETLSVQVMTGRNDLSCGCGFATLARLLEYSVTLSN